MRTFTRSFLLRAVLPALAAVSVGAVSLASLPAHAQAPFSKVAAPGFYRFTLGDFEVTALSDGTVGLPVEQLLSEPQAKTRDALKKAFLSTPLETSVNAYLVNTGSKLVLIDTGAGALFGPTLGKLAANLKASGYEPAQVDEIYITHMHPDHVGGLAASGAAVFTNAVVRADQRDADFWLSASNLAAAPEASKGFFQGAQASLSPYSASSKLKPFDGATELVPGIFAVPTYGHTAGHITYRVESKGQQMLVIGDLIHVAAVQMGKPATTITFDTDARAARGMRLKVFGQAAREGTLIAASHIQFPGLGRLRTHGKGFEWVPANYAPATKN